MDHYISYLNVLSKKLDICYFLYDFNLKKHNIYSQLIDKEVSAMNTNNAKQIVEKAEAMGLSHKDIAEICNVSVGTVSRWKKVGKARAKVIGLLENELSKASKPEDKPLSEATLEDLAARARDLGFRVSFTDTKQ